MMSVESLAIRYQDKKLFVLDQRKIPNQELWLECCTVQDMVECIQTLAVRGAPLIGTAAALSLLQLCEQGCSEQEFIASAQHIRTARPTAVNLAFTVDALVAEAKKVWLPQNILKLVQQMVQAEIIMSEAMAKIGKKFIDDGDAILTHCNTGALATVGRGTALAVIHAAFSEGKKIHVYVDETRPLLQGARLTTWELAKLHIPHTLICDNMAASLMRAGKIKKVFVGADRIALNGDFANKIGTYSVAICAQAHNIPFYPVAPLSTVDFLCPRGEDIIIEERSPEEVRREWSPKSVPVFNPAFDITPVTCIDHMILNTGAYSQTQLQSGILSKLRG